MTQQVRLRIAIVGGGIGGLACAIFLCGLATDIQVDVYEAAAKFTTVGAGVGMLPRPMAILERFGVKDPSPGENNENKQANRFTMRKSDQLDGIIFGETGGSDPRNVTVLFHRAELLDQLKNLLPDSCKTHFSARLTSYTESPSGVIDLQFANGLTACCDMLVGADGLKSAVRGTMSRLRGDAAGVEPTWSGNVIYRGLADSETLKKMWPDHRALTTPMMYMGKNKNLVVYPVSQGRLINIAAVVLAPELEGTAYEGPWVKDVAMEDMLQEYADWEPEVTALLKSVERYSLWAVHVVMSLPSYIHGHVALIGDAAHAMTPFQGSGAGQSVEDAYILATLLAHPATTPKTLPRALQIYNDIRLPFSRDIQERSRANGRLFQLNGPGFEDISAEDSAAGAVPVELLKRVSDRVEEQIRWAWCTSIDEDHANAIRLMDDEYGVGV